MEKNNIDISNLTIDELVSLREDINNRILDYEDGFIYICNVRSYGRNWNEFIGNEFTLNGKRIPMRVVTLKVLKSIGKGWMSGFLRMEMRLGVGMDIVHPNLSHRKRNSN